MPFNILPGACPEEQYVLQAPTQNLSWSPLADGVLVYNAFLPPSGGNLSGFAEGSPPEGNPPFTYFVRIQDPNTSTGFASEWPGVLIAQVALRNGSPQATGGTYTIAIRCRSTVSTPNNAVLIVNISNGGGHPNSFSYTQTINISSLGSEYQIFTWSPSEVLPDAFAILFFTGSGFTGLVIDYVSCTQNTMLTDSQQLTNNSLSGWIASNPPPITTNNNVWYGQGLYHEHWGIETAIQAIGGITLESSPWYTSGATRSFNNGNLTNVTIMASYKLLILNNIDLLTFYYDARDWLRGYVNAGGRILMCGGVYSCGRGYWQTSNLASPLFPTTFSNFDLQPGGGNSINPTPQTFQLNTGGIYSSTLIAPPVCLWSHNLSPNEGATVQATVSGDPAIVTNTYGAGKVAVIGLTPHGVVGNNNVWWEYEQWSTLVIQPLIQWLLT